MRVDFGQINWWAVLVAAIATFFLGAVWYSALFGKLWVRMQGWTEEQAKQIQAAMNPAVFFGGMLVSYLLLAVVMAILVTNFDLRTIAAGALLGFLLWVGVAAAIHFTGHLASNKPIGAFLIDTGFQFIYLIGMGAILAAWR
jgi:hypothetical protein